MNKSTVHRLLGALGKMHFLLRDPSTGLYQLGIRLFQMAYLAMEQSGLRQHAAPFLHRLCEQLRETITFSILDDTDAFYLDVVDSLQRVKLAALWVPCEPASPFALAWSFGIQVIQVGDRLYRRGNMKGWERYKGPTSPSIYQQGIRNWPPRAFY